MKSNVANNVDNAVTTTSSNYLKNKRKKVFSYIYVLHNTQLFTYGHINFAQYRNVSFHANNTKQSYTFEPSILEDTSQTNVSSFPTTQAMFFFFKQ